MEVNFNTKVMFIKTWPKLKQQKSRNKEILYKLYFSSITEGRSPFNKGRFSRDPLFIATIIGNTYEAKSLK